MGENEEAKSRIFWLKGDVEESAQPVQNEKTVFLAPGEPLPSHPQLSFRELFTKHYPQIRERIAGSSRAGVTVVAMDVDAVRGAAFLAAKPDVVATAVIGRHTQADLRLGSDPSLSLRHLALLLYPRTSHGQTVRYRLLDLRTATGFIDERGKRLRAVEADGPAFVRCGRYSVLIFPAGDTEGSWPEDPDEAWEKIPERLYLDEVETVEKSEAWDRDSDRAWEVDALPGLKELPTLVHHVAGPQMAVHELIEEGESPLGELHISSARGTSTITLGHKAVRAGVLLGRSRRCDAGKVLADRSVSRVHMLIIEIAGRLFAIDTASYNGVWDEDEQERATALEVKRALSLGDVATVVWHSVGATDSSEQSSAE